MDTPEYYRDCAEEAGLDEDAELEIARILYQHRNDYQGESQTANELAQLGTWYALVKYAQGEIQLLCRNLLAREDIAQELAHIAGVDNFGTVKPGE